MKYLNIISQRVLLADPIFFAQRKLKVLNASGNQLDSIEDLGCMDVLDTLNLSRNKLANLDHISQVLQGLRQLRILDLRENSIVKDHKYKEKIIGYCSGIGKTFFQI